MLSARRCFPILSLLFAVGCAVEVPLEQSADEDVTASGASLTKNTNVRLWTENQNRIPVCWLNVGETQTKELVRAAVKRTWERVANITTYGWDECSNYPANEPRIRIDLFAEGDGGKASLGMDALRTGNDVSISLGGNTSLDRGRLEYLAVHEFGHTLGFEHEHLRMDAPDASIGCLKPGERAERTARNGVSLGTLTYYDADSIMHYCNHGGNVTGFLTALDVAGVRSVYGARHERKTYELWSKVKGDFNGDGRDDLFAVAGPSSATKFRGLFLADAGGASFRTGCAGGGDSVCDTDNEPYAFHPNTRYLQGDFNGDGRADVLVISGDPSFRRRIMYLGRADGTKLDVACYGESGTPCGLNDADDGTDARHRYLTADVNGDGKTDLIAISGNPAAPRRAVYVATGQGFRAVCTGTADGTCGLDTEAYSMHQDTRYIAGDYNGDGRSDLLVVSGDSSQRRRILYLANGSGTGFDVACYDDQDGACGLDTESYSMHPETKYIPGDFDGDGRTDLLVFSGDPAFPRRILYVARPGGAGFAVRCFGNGDGACSFDTEPFTAHPGTDILPGDFNGDGKTDIAVFSRDYSIRRRSIHLGNGTATGFTVACTSDADSGCGFDTENYALNPDTRYVTGDYNGDGRTDVAVLSDDSAFPRKAIYLANTDGASFRNSCYGQTPTACGLSVGNVPMSITRLLSKTAVTSSR